MPPNQQTASNNINNSEMNLCNYGKQIQTQHQ